MKKLTRALHVITLTADKAKYCQKRRVISEIAVETLLQAEKNLGKAAKNLKKAMMYLERVAHVETCLCSDCEQVNTLRIRDDL